jgi:glycosyltransferase involved in cell wall biosynthesis
MSRIDVIIPCYKYAHFLRGCVDSVTSQPVTDLRVLILDDCSPDNTPEVAAELLARDRRIAYRRHAVNQGHVATFNEGLDWACGDYTLLLSADDMLTPGALGRAVRFLDAHPEVGLVYGRQIVFRTDQPLPEAGPFPDECGSQVFSGSAFLEAACATGSNLVPTPTAVVRTRLQKELGGYRSDLPHTGDLEMWLRFAAHAPVGVLDADQAYYRRHGSNMSSGYYGTPLGDLQHRKAAFTVLFQEHGSRIDNAERLQGVMTRSLAEEAFWVAYHAFNKGDVGTCRAYLRFAGATYPPIRSWAVWARLRWKRLLGPRLWSWVRPVVDRFRGCLIPAAQHCR